MINLHPLNNIDNINMFDEINLIKFLDSEGLSYKSFELYDSIDKIILLNFLTKKIMHRNNIKNNKIEYLIEELERIY